MSDKFSIDQCKINPVVLKYLERSFIPTIEDVEHEYNPFLISGLQNYNPIYDLFFKLNESDYNTITLNNEKHIIDLEKVFDVTRSEENPQPVFIKFSPLLDPIRYMIGKYKSDDKSIRILPKPQSIYSDNELKSHSKLLDPNNAAYTDNFFSFLSSKLLNNHGFIHGINFYGSFLGIQEKYKMNITDDLEYLNSSTYFNENKNKLFTLTETTENEFNNFGSRANKHKIQISESDKHNITAISLEVLDLNSDYIQEDVNSDKMEELIYEKSESNIESKSINEEQANGYTNCESDDSSDSENSNKSDSDSDDSDDSDDNNDNDDIDDSDDSDDNNDNDNDKYSSNWETESDAETEENYFDDEENQKYTFIRNFPVQLICLEKCDGTIDELFVKEQLDINTAASALFQIIMILISYQKAYHFTHNDLHTNNIMYINTDIEYLYYKYNNKYYKVPTYGKIFKLIDFGRSIYRFNGKIFCSDSFANGGDAATQYNCEPYLNNSKPRLDPNYSFDLCRLGCSIYDFIIDTDNSEDIEQFDEFQKTIYRWCLDDNDKNVLYKRNGDERYPNFKLYKMIARTVHKHTPESQLEYQYFNQFLIKEIDNSSCSLMDIDKLPCYVL
jgi:hypothetical protein